MSWMRRVPTHSMVAWTANDDMKFIGVNFTGAIAIARYGGIFRGLKVHDILHDE